MNNIYNQSVFLVAGHSNSDPGAIAYDGTTEAELTKDLRDLIYSHISDCHVFEGSAIIDCDNHNLPETIEAINNLAGKNDLLVDIHFNFNHSTATGAEVFYSTNTNVRNMGRAFKLSALISDVLGNKNRGSKPDTMTAVGSLGILRRTAPEALLIEPCFMNAQDLNNYRLKKGQLAKALADFIKDELVAMRS